MQIGPKDILHPGEVDLTDLPILGHDPETGKRTDRMGIPFAKDPGPVRPEETRGTRYRGLEFVQVFDTTNQQDMAAYRMVRQSIMDGKAAQVRLVQGPYDPNIGGWKILLEWAVFTAYLPKQIRAGAPGAESARW